MAPVFLPWNGRAATLEETFAKTLPFGLTGEVWVRPKTLEVYPGLAVSDAQIGITATAEETRLAASAKTAEGDKVNSGNCLGARCQRPEDYGATEPAR